MPELKLAPVEALFADLVWKNEPIHSRELANLCREELGWQRTTTYTVLKKLCKRGILQNMDGLVSSMLSRPEFSEPKAKNWLTEPSAVRCPPLSPPLPGVSR